MEKRICYGCMKEVTEPVCPHCGHPEQGANAPHQRKVGTVLNEKYLLGRAVNQSPCAITYIALDQETKETVLLRESFPQGALRQEDGSVAAGLGMDIAPALEQFRQEAQAVNAVDIIRKVSASRGFFESDGTIYQVSDSVRGPTLGRYVTMRGGELTLDETMRLLEPVLQAVAAYHRAGMVHGNVHMETIFLDPMGGARLLAFGEQPGARAEDDVYALSRVLCGCLSRQAQHQAVNPADIPCLTGDMVQALSIGLAPDPRHRFASAVALHKALLSPAPAQQAPVEPDAKAEEVPPTQPEPIPFTQPADEEPSQPEPIPFTQPADEEPSQPEPIPFTQPADEEPAQPEPIRFTQSADEEPEQPEGTPFQPEMIKPTEKADDDLVPPVVIPIPEPPKQEPVVIPAPETPKSAPQAIAPTELIGGHGARPQLPRTELVTPSHPPVQNAPQQPVYQPPQQPPVKPGRKGLVIALVAVAVIVVALLIGFFTIHSWKDATCDAPRTCSLCGKTEGKPLSHSYTVMTCTEDSVCEHCGELNRSAPGHHWQEANCQTPKTCANCGETEGTPQGHSWEDATCHVAKTCSICGETEGEALGHDWEPATYTAPETCNRCGLTRGNIRGYYAEMDGEWERLRYGTTTTYALVWDIYVKQCRSFTLDFEPTFSGGTYVRDWKVMYRDGSGTWHEAKRFSLGASGTASVQVNFSSPKYVTAVMVLPSVNGSYSYSFDFWVTDIYYYD